MTVEIEQRQAKAICSTSILQKAAADLYHLSSGLGSGPLKSTFAV